MNETGVPHQTKTEYRLAVDRGFGVRLFDKRDLEHARKGVEDSYRDFKRYNKWERGWSAWVETREVGEWGKDDV